MDDSESTEKRIALINQTINSNNLNETQNEFVNNHSRNYSLKNLELKLEKLIEHLNLKEFLAKIERPLNKHALSNFKQAKTILQTEFSFLSIGNETWNNYEKLRLFYNFEVRNIFFLFLFQNFI